MIQIIIEKVEVLLVLGYVRDVARVVEGLRVERLVDPVSRVELLAIVALLIILVALGVELIQALRIINLPDSSRNLVRPQYIIKLIPRRQ